MRKARDFYDLERAGLGDEFVDAVERAMGLIVTNPESSPAVLRHIRKPKREIIRRLGTSPAQLYRLLDTTNYRKSIDSVVELLQVLDCAVEFVVRERANDRSAVASAGMSRLRRVDSFFG